jgi:hypothetical protein
MIYRGQHATRMDHGLTADRTFGPVSGSVGGKGGALCADAETSPGMAGEMTAAGGQE